MSEAGCINTCPNKNGCQVMAMLDKIDEHEEAIRLSGIESLIDVENPANLVEVLAVERRYDSMMAGEMEVPRGVSGYVAVNRNLLLLREDVAQSCEGPKTIPRHPLLRAIGLSKSKEVCGQTIKPDEFYERLFRVIKPVFAGLGITSYDEYGRKLPVSIRIEL